MPSKPLRRVADHKVVSPWCMDRFTTRHRQDTPTGCAQQSAPAAYNRWGASEKLADFGGQFADRIAHVGGHFGMLARVLAVQRPERNRQLDRLHDARAGNPEGLPGLVVRPNAAVLAVRSADHGQRLALEGAVAEGPGKPVDRVLDHRRDAP